MFLGLLCEHTRLGHTFPSNAFEVSSKYNNSRLKRDAIRVTDRYQISITEVRDIAEEIAFSITADLQIGLNPHRSELYAATQRQRFRRSRSRVFKAVDALEYMKLGKQDLSSNGVSNPRFTFAHRRFQEYFATSIVVKDVSRVSPRILLLNARWRETAVVVCQTGLPAQVEPLLREAENLLIEAYLSVATSFPSEDQARVPPEMAKIEHPFVWPYGSTHIIEILQDGFSARLGLIPDPVRELAGKIVTLGFDNGDFLDKKSALRAAGVCPEADLEPLLRKGLKLDSQVINDVIYRQVAKLASPPPYLMTALREGLLRISLASRSVRSRNSLEAFVRRLPTVSGLAEAARLASWTRFIGIGLTLVAFAPLIMQLGPAAALLAFVTLALQIAWYSLYLSPNRASIQPPRFLTLECALMLYALVILLNGIPFFSKASGLVAGDQHYDTRWIFPFYLQGWGTHISGFYSNLAVLACDVFGFLACFG